MGIRKKIRLGDEVQHTITDFKGTVHARAEYMNGCVQFEVIPRKLTEDGQINEGIWIDEQLLKIIPKPRPRFKKDKKPPGGGFRSHPINFPKRRQR